jgi:hypothetical protein
MALFQITCQLILFILDLWCGLLHPIYETLFYLRYQQQHTKVYESKLTHWTTYWIFYCVLHLIQKILYFFPFSYEIRVILTLLMAHPQIEAASTIYNFLVTNPLIMIKLIDLRNRLRDKLDKEILPKMKEYRIYENKNKLKAF